MKDNSQFLTLLFLLFLGLKLGGAITWSWWAVFAPIWVPLAIIAALLLLIIVLKSWNYISK